MHLPKSFFRFSLKISTKGLIRIDKDQRWLTEYTVITGVDVDIPMQGSWWGSRGEKSGKDKRESVSPSGYFINIATASIKGYLCCASLTSRIVVV